MRSIIILLSFIYVALRSAFTMAIDSSSRIENYTVADGLPHNWVFDVKQDQQGYIWLATESGLTRYNGYEFTTFKHNLNDPHSLSHNVVWTLFVDSKHRLWVGTWEGGLNLFDAKKERFIRYPLLDANNSKNTLNKATRNGLDSIRSITEDAQGNLWIATASGLVKLDADTGVSRHFLPIKDDANSLSHRWVRVVKFDNNNRLWIGTEGGGISVYEPHSDKFFQIRANSGNPNALSNDNINDIYFDQQNNLWIGTENGLNQLHNWQDIFDLNGDINPSFDVQFSHFYHQPSNPNSLSHNDIISIYQNHGGQLWVGTPNGLNQLLSHGEIKRFDKTANPSSNFLGKYIYQIFEDSQHNLWLATDDGISRILKERLPFNSVSQITATNLQKPINLSNFESLTDVYQQGNGDFWLATKQGLIKQSADGKLRIYKNTSQNNSLSDSHIHALGEDNNNNLWVASHRGLNLYRAKSDDFERFYHQPDNPNSLSHIDINTIFRDSQGVMWFGTGAGVNVLKSQDLSSSTSTKSFDCYFCAKTGHEQNITVLSISETRDNHILLGTWEAGLLYLNPKDGSYKQYKSNINNESMSEIWGMHQQSLSKIWLATSNGLQYFDYHSKTITPANLPKALQKPSFEILADDSDRLWFSTNNAIVRFNPKSNNYWVYEYQNDSEAKSFVPRHGYKDKNGILYFTGLGSYIRFDPNQILDDHSKPNVVLTDLLLANKKVKIRNTSLRQKANNKMYLNKAIDHLDMVTFDHSQNYFGFEFAALNVSFADKVQYAYQLEGFDNDWIYTSFKERKAAYTNLTAGNYTFKVRATNNDGIWDHQVKSIKIKVLPPPWLTWWAIGLYLTVIISFIWLFYTNHSQNTKLKYQQQVNQQLTQLDKLKDQFLANTSHELRTPLNGIIGLAESLIDGERGPLSVESKQDLSLVVSSAKRLSNLVNDILDYSKLKDRHFELNIVAIDLKIMVDMMLTLSRPLVAKKTVELINHIPADIPLVAADENRLQQILHNLIGNAIKFTQLGSVEVSAIVSGNKTTAQSWLTITISDTGIGISEDKLKRIFDSFEQADGSANCQYSGTGLSLSVTRQLVERHGGQITAQSKLEEGSHFSFTLPLC